MKILFVCLGNICRSPTAEVVFRAVASREAPDLALEIDSAGTAGYHVGELPDRRTRQAAARRGYDLSALRARGGARRPSSSIPLTPPPGTGKFGPPASRARR